MEDITETSAIRRCDLDEILAYRAPITVILRDRWLGVARLGGVFVVLGYFLIGKMYLGQGYLGLNPLVGAADIYKQEPPASTRTTFAELPYCEEFPGSPPSDYRFAQKPCVNLPIQDITAGSDNKQTFFTLRLKDMAKYGLDCMQTSPYIKGETNCEREVNGSRADYHYVANIEDALIYVRTAVVRSAENRQGGSKAAAVYSTEFDGVMHCGSDATYTVKTEQLGRGKREYDKFTVGELLHCAGIDLDKMSGDGKYAYRFTGLELLMEVTYRYGRWGKLVGYDYYVTPFPMKVLRFLPDHGVTSAYDGGHPASNEAFEARGGLNIMLEIKGFEGEVSFEAFMISWVSTMALIGIVPVVLGVLMRHVLPLRALYREYLDRCSVDFSAFKHGEPQAVQGANALVHTNAFLKGMSFTWEYSHSEADEVKSCKTRPSQVNAPEVQLSVQQARLEKVELAVREEGMRASNSERMSVREEGMSASIQNECHNYFSNLEATMNEKLKGLLARMDRIERLAALGQTEDTPTNQAGAEEMVSRDTAAKISSHPHALKENQGSAPSDSHMTPREEDTNVTPRISNLSKTTLENNFTSAELRIGELEKAMGQVVVRLEQMWHCLNSAATSQKPVSHPVPVPVPFQKPALQAVPDGSERQLARAQRHQDNVDGMVAEQKRVSKMLEARLGYLDQRVGKPYVGHDIADSSS